MFEKVRVKGLVKGKVQGVFYRASAKSVADNLNLSGWIKNRSDGSVEFEIQGMESSVLEFLDWAKQGPDWCRVDQLEHNQIPLMETNEFEILRK